MLYEPILKKNLTLLLEAYARGTGRSTATISSTFSGDWRFFDRVLEQGCSFTIAQYDRVASRFALDWPDDVAWPAGVPRPSQREAEAVAKKSKSPKSS